MVGLLDTEHLVQYRGSQTERPCAEGLEWNILAKVQPISDYQLEFFTNK